MRVLGDVFNPLSAFWCHDASGDPVAVVAEVHNTYGERHAYLLRPGPDGRAESAKEFVAALTEKRRAGRPGLAEYVERTSGFVPLPPKQR